MTIKLPDPEECWTPSEVHDILLAFTTGQLVEKKADERATITIRSGRVQFRGYIVALLAPSLPEDSPLKSIPQTIAHDFQDLLLGLDND